ncbi:MAG TPA: desulfoferrodoxin [Mogibacterium sp.]|nr:desulfoferrodoxin [Mogibacterium sp.]
MKFKRCAICGQIVAMVKETGVPMICCGEPMQELVAGTTDAAQEKHVPVYTVDGNKVHVKVAEVEHPMIEEHYIEWIALETKQGVQRKELKPGEKPEACFSICDGDEVVAAYEYCNLHSLWKA